MNQNKMTSDLSTSKKVLAWVITLAIIAPVFLAFKDNGDAFWNVAGVAYACVLYGYAGKIFPEWVKDYLKRA